MQSVNNGREDRAQGNVLTFYAITGHDEANVDISDPM